ncbi:MAG: CRISPR-associated endonuclease Cas1 [Caldilineaceae bacterium]|nr:CRISPR-associated endonuclease Cas1 [Caldilineaceae bacterium]
MTTLYVNKQGASVNRLGERIEVSWYEKASQRKQVLATQPVRDLEQLVLYGNVQLTTPAAALLLRHDVHVIFLGRYGDYRGTLLHQGSKFARLRHRQLLLSSRSDEMRQVAVQIVRAKLRHQRDLLQTLAEQVGSQSAGALQAAAQGIEQMRKACPSAGTLDAVRGFEGKGSAFYFGGMRTLLDKSWSFERRAYYPPPDPFNALLSFGYGLLRKDIEATAHLVGLDPYLGCLHEMEMSRPSLVLDLMEEFRPLLVDRATLDLVLGEKITPAEFTFTGRQDRPVELGEKLLPLVINAYETRSSDLVLHGPSQMQNTIRRCFELQARIYARVIMGERQEYEGV